MTQNKKEHDINNLFIMLWFEYVATSHFMKDKIDDTVVVVVLNSSILHIIYSIYIERERFIVIARRARAGGRAFTSRLPCIYVMEWSQ